MKFRRDICQAMDPHGKKCRNEAVASHNYHGSHEIYDYFDGRPTWVRIRLCRKHNDLMPHPEGGAK